MLHYSSSPRIVPVLFFVSLCACSSTPKSHEVPKPLPAHLTDADGAPVPGAPEPEVVQLRNVEMVEGMMHVTVGNVGGDYVLVCNPSVNKDVGVQSCLALRPQRDYLLFRKNTKWLVKGAKEPINLEFMQVWSVTYNDKENIGLLPARNSEEEHFRLFWLSSWTASRPAS
jgi:hypothetical protein